MAFKAGVGGVDVAAVQQGRFSLCHQTRHQEAHGDAVVAVALQRGSVQWLAMY